MGVKHEGVQKKSGTEIQKLPHTKKNVGQNSRKSMFRKFSRDKITPARAERFFAKGALDSMKILARIGMLRHTCCVSDSSQTEQMSKTV